MQGVTEREQNREDNVRTWFKVIADEDCSCILLFWWSKLTRNEESSSGVHKRVEREKNLSAYNIRWQLAISTLN